MTKMIFKTYKTFRFCSVCRAKFQVGHYLQRRCEFCRQHN